MQLPNLFYSLVGRSLLGNRAPMQSGQLQKWRKLSGNKIRQPLLRRKGVRVQFSYKCAYSSPYSIGSGKHTFLGTT